MKKILAIILLFFLYPAYAEESTKCKPLLISDFPKEDIPTETEFKSVKIGESRGYYYGIGHDIDYKKAKIAAFRELKDEDKWEIGGSAILVMLYANGYGVKKNIEFAKKIICGNLDDFGYGRIECQMNQLEKFKSGGQKVPFDICQYCGNTFFEGHCYAIEVDKKNYGYNMKFKEILDKFTPEKRSAFDAISRTAEAYIIARANNNEVDISGTGRAVFSMEEEDALRKKFLDFFIALEKGKYPRYSKEDYEKLDKELNSAYSLIQNCENFEYGTVNKEGIKMVEKLWVKYKQSWEKNGPLIYQNVPVYACQAWLTAIRLENLRYFVWKAEEINWENMKQKEYAKITGNWDGKTKHLFDSLTATAWTYMNGRAWGEMPVENGKDYQDTEQIKLEKNFLQLLKDLEAKKLENRNEGDFNKADKEMKDLYESIIWRKDFKCGDIKQDMIEKVQDKWQTYCTGWESFAEERYPGVVNYALKTFLVNERISQLRQFEKNY